MAAGRRLFAAQGLKKTNVAELTQACGIAKGSFYHFFDAKEVLFMEILEAIETDIKADVSRQLEEMEGRPDDYFEKIGISFEFPNIYTKLTAMENLAFFGAMYRGKTASSRSFAGRTGKQGERLLRTEAV